MLTINASFHGVPRNFKGNPGKTQNGAITLPIALILLVLLTLITIYAARVGVLETRASANKVRADEAFQAAEAGIEQGIAYVNRNRDTIDTGFGVGWTQCASTDTAPPCGELPSAQRASWLYIEDVAGTIAATIGSYTLHFMTPCQDLDGTAGCDSPPSPYTYAPITMVAQGVSEDGTSNAILRQTATLFDMGGGDSTVPVPIMAPGNIPLNGNYTVVTNPNGAGPGAPLSVWTGATVDLTTGSVVTCYEEEFLNSKASSFWDTTTNPGISMCDSCVCNPDTTGSLSQSSGNIKDYDILDNDPNFPDDVFQYFTGTPEASYPAVIEIIKAISDLKPHYLTDCSTLDTNSSGWYWVDGNCNPSSSVGSLENPVKLIVNGNATFNGNSYLFGVLFVFSPPPSYPARELKTNGNVTIYGAMMSNQDVDMPTGGFVMRYSGDVMGNLANNASNAGFGKLPYSWADF
jgi:hypothetical protein